MKIIRTEVEYKEALNIVAELFDNPPAKDTPEGDKFEALIALIVAYEEKQYPIDATKF